MHPKLLEEYAEFCDIREGMPKSERSIRFKDTIDFYPVKLLPLCDLFRISVDNLDVFPPSRNPLVIIPCDKRKADDAFQHISRIHQPVA